MYDKNMELRSKIYRMFVLGPSEDFLIKGGNLDRALNEGLGGVIFFTKNIKSESQMKKFTFDIKNSAKFPVFLSIDQEGGRVERTENIFGGKKWLSARYQAQKGLKCVQKQSAEISDCLKSLGLNMNFAPVLDVDTNPENPIIAERSYGNNSEDVIKYAITAMETYLEYGIVPVGKHFPGHGDVNVDSHLAMPTLELSLVQTEKNHIEPFKAAIKAGLPAIMVAHMHCTCFDEEKIPASLSKNVIKKYLRGHLGFGGLVVSDDMVMGGVSQFEPLEAVVRGVNAGINLFLYRNSDDETIDLIEALVKIAETDDELRENIENSFDKIQKLSAVIS